MNILFLCVANSARSQMAEGVAKKIFGSTAWVESAGSKPKAVHPTAIQVMKEVGIDISHQRSKSTSTLSPTFVNELNYVITLCVDEICPSIFSEAVSKLHWPLPDPVPAMKSDDKGLVLFRKVRDEIIDRIEELKESLSGSHS